MNTDEQVPVNGYEAAAWLRSRHPWLDQLLTRCVGSNAATPERTDWLDELVDAFNEITELDRQWEAYELVHPEPSDLDAQRRWVEAGPRLTSAAAVCIAPMSSGEVQMLRLLVTLNPRVRAQAGWRLDDIDFDDRGVAVVRDWLKVVQARL